MLQEEITPKPQADRRAGVKVELGEANDRRAQPGTPLMSVRARVSSGESALEDRPKRSFSNMFAVVCLSF